MHGDGALVNYRKLEPCFSTPKYTRTQEWHERGHKCGPKGIKTKTTGEIIKQ